MSQPQRSRRGCNRCRLKKLKCDERKPSCDQCRHRNIPCPGYQREIRWSSKYEVFGTSVDAFGNSTAPSKKRPKTSSTSHLPDHAIRHRNGLTGTPRDDEGPSTAEIRGQAVDLTDEPDQETATSPAVDPKWADSAIETRRPQSQSTAPWYFDRMLQPTEDLVLNQSDNTTVLQPNVAIGSASPGPSENLDLQGLPLEATPSPNGLADVAITIDPSEDPAVLQSHYFDMICRIHSTFDYPANPFRRLALRYINSSKLVHHCIISMSAAHLLQGNRRKISQCIQYLSAAVRTLSDALSHVEATKAGTNISAESPLAQIDYSQQLEEVLFASILLGWSQPWYDPKDLGVPHLLGARKICQKWLHTLPEYQEGEWSKIMLDEDKSFLIGAMAYWEAASAFIFDQPLDSTEYLLPFVERQSFINVHPHTGVATSLFIILAQVGICVRQQRTLKRVEFLSWNKDAYDSMSDQILQTAMRMQHHAMKYTLPLPQEVRGLETSATPLRQILCFAQIYQLALLLELYRSFPSLLDPEVGPGKRANNHPITTSPLASSHEHIHHGHSSGTTQFKRQEQDRRLNEIALALLGLIEEMPERHESSLFQTLALIISGSTLITRPEENSDESPSEFQNTLTMQLNAISMRPEAVEKWRALIRKRMAVNSLTFGLREVFERAEQLLEEVWSRADSIKKESISPSWSNTHLQPHSVNWVDVMVEHRLETLFG